MNFTTKELSLLDCALSVAAMVYDSDAETARKEGQHRVADQFVEQAKEARDLAARFNGAYLGAAAIGC